MKNTCQILLNWDKGSTFSERMSAKILFIEDYYNIDPQNPSGGPDGTKDIICYKNSLKYIVGCYFPNGQKDFNDIKKKFVEDLKGKSKNKANGFVFITNQKLTPSERIKLVALKRNIEIYHLERICSVLDSPKGYGVRLEYLGIELNKEEQLSFLDSHLRLKEEFAEIRNQLSSLNKVTLKIANEILPRDVGNRLLSTLPISGVKFSSRLSMEDLFAIQKMVSTEDNSNGRSSNYGFRNVDVWVGSPGTSKKEADYIPPAPSLVPKRIFELLNWWREEYMKVCYSDEPAKISVIASFHEKFLSIHPFLDGNGRIARFISSLQYKDLLDKDIRFESIDRQEYYKALQKARYGNAETLNNIFVALIK